MVYNHQKKFRWEDMRIGELAVRAGVSRDTIRFYERERLLTSAPSSSITNAYREYDDRALTRIRFIKEAQEVGFSLAHIRLWLDDYLDGKLSPTESFQVLRQHVLYLDERIAKLEAMRSAALALLQAKEQQMGQ